MTPREKRAYQDVRIVAAEDILPDYETINSMTHCVVVGDKKIVQFCSENYMLIPNKSITKPFEERLGAEHKFDLNISMYDDRRFWFNYIIKDKLIGGKKDGILPAIKVQNSYDGGLRYILRFGFYRLICSNGMMIPEAGTEETQVTLTHSLGNKNELERAFDRIDDFLSESKEMAEPYQQLMAQKVKSPEERIMDVIEHTKFPSRQAEQVTARFHEELQLGLESTDWITYNALNYQLNHNEEIKMQEHKKEKLDIQLLDYLID